MKRGFLFSVQGPFGFLRYSFLIASIFMGLAGCVPQPSNEIIIPIVICTPQSPIVNVYRSAPQPWTNIIFDFAFPPASPQFNDQQILSARYAAFLQLIDETKRWSNIQTVKLDDSSEVTITLTYLSPELLQAVFLNEVLKNRFPTSGFQNELQRMLNTIAEREELLFLLTVTITNHTVNPALHSIRIPIEKLIMTNSENIIITPSHDDHNLELHMDTSSKPVFGYIAFPFAQVSADQCEWVLDPKFNQNIVMSVPFIEVNGVGNQRPVSWTIPYAPLINMAMPSKAPLLNQPVGVDPITMMPMKLPPIGMNQSNNWQDFARYIWNQVTVGNY